MDRHTVIADSDAMIDYVQAEGCHAQVTSMLKQGRLGTTSVTVFELWRGCDTDDKKDEIRRALRGVRIYGFGLPAAKRAGELARLLDADGNTIGERDTMIAATCLAARLPLLTRNVKHFRRVPSLRIVEGRLAS